MTSSAPGHLHALLTRFRGATEGAIAVEFAFTFPVLLFLLFGMVETGQLVQTQHRIDNAGASIGDVVSRYAAIATSDETDIFNAATDIMGANAAVPPDLRISQIVMTPSGVLKWDWSDRQGIYFPSHAHCDPVVISEVQGLNAAPITPGSNVIVSEVHYKWSSPFNYVLTKPLDLKSATILSPRNGSVSRQTTPTPAACT